MPSATVSAPPRDPFLAAIWRALPGYEDTDTDVFGLLGYSPTERQRTLHAATEFDVLYGGAVGGGKSAAAVLDDIRDCIRFPGIRIGAFRRTYPELNESLIAQLAHFGFAQALPVKLRPTWNGTERELRFPNGSVITYRYAETVKDATRRQGGQYQKLTFDEYTLTLPAVVEFLRTRLRSGNSRIPVLGVRAYSNPGGPGHGAAKARYIVPTNYGLKVVTDERGRTVRFIPAKLSDNPHVNPEYASDLAGLPPEMRAAFLDGNWDIFAGAAFPEWNHDRHVITRPFPIPAEWPRYAGIDYGYAAPWVVLWFAVDGDGRVWVYREVHATKVGEREQAARILAAEDGEPVTARFADSSMWAKVGDAKPVADTYAELGVPLTPADKGPGSRVHRKARLHAYLADGPACAIHRAQGWEECPMLHVVGPAAPNLVRTLPDLPSDPVKVEDVDTNADDHDYDALSYGLVMLGTEPGWVWSDRTETLAEQAGEPVLQQFGRYAADPSGGAMSSPWG